MVIKNEKNKKKPSLANSKMWSDSMVRLDLPEIYIDSRDIYRFTRDI